jgi:hypothetical protein
MAKITPEAVLLKNVMLEASKLGARVWRNHVGGFYTKDGRYQRTGLCKGSSDLIGIYQGRFLAIECKTTIGRLSPEQTNFLEQVNKNGGIGIVCRDEKDLEKMLAIL